MVPPGQPSHTIPHEPEDIRPGDWEHDHRRQLVAHSFAVHTADGSEASEALVHTVVLDPPRGATSARRHKAALPSARELRCVTPSSGYSTRMLILSPHGSRHVLVYTSSMRSIDLVAFNVVDAKFHPASDEYICVLTCEDVVEVHYAPAEDAERTQTSVVLRFTPRPATGEVDPAHPLATRFRSLSFLDETVSSPVLLALMTAGGDLYAMPFAKEAVANASQVEHTVVARNAAHIAKADVRDPKAHVTSMDCFISDLRAGNYSVVCGVSNGVVQIFRLNESEILRGLETAMQPAAPNAPAAAAPSAAVRTLRLIADFDVAGNVTERFSVLLHSGRDASRNFFVIGVTPVTGADPHTRLEVGSRRHLLLCVPVWSERIKRWVCGASLPFESKVAPAFDGAAQPPGWCIAIPSAQSGFAVKKAPAVGDLAEVDWEHMAALGLDTGTPTLCEDTLAFAEAHPNPHVDDGLISLEINTMFVPLYELFTTARLAGIAYDTQLSIHSDLASQRPQLLQLAERSAELHQVACFEAHRNVATRLGWTYTDEPHRDPHSILGQAETLMHEVTRGLLRFEHDVKQNRDRLEQRESRLQMRQEAVQAMQQQLIVSAERSRMYAEGVESLQDLKNRMFDLLDELADQEEELIVLERIAAAEEVATTSQFSPAPRISVSTPENDA